MTTHLPERVIIDAEFVDDEHDERQAADGGTTRNTKTAASGATTDSPAADGTAAAEGPDLGARLAAALARQGRREYAALREGLTILKTETGTWAAASKETPAHLRASLLNRRYATWTAKQSAEVERLEEKAGELEKKARRALAAGQTDEASTADHKQATTVAAALNAEAADWRERAREIQRQPYTGHIEPVDAELERHRRRTANKRRTGLAVLTLALGGFELAVGNLILPTITATGLLLTAWAKGRISGWRRELPDVPALAYEIATGKPAKDKKDKDSKEQVAAAPFDGALFPGDTGKPFHIHDVTTPAVAAECVRRALLAEDIPLAHVDEPVQHPWGWEVVVRVSEGTSGDIGDKLGALETKFDVGDGDVILQPNRKRTSEATLRIVTGDLFGAMKPAPYRAPHSVDITEAGVFGMSADGTDLRFSLAELMGEVIARSGGGKSTLIRALLDWTTAAYNAVTVFLDPSGDGPGKFEDAVKLTSTSPIQIEFALLSLYRLAAGRARIRRKLGMGDTWKCSREHPAVFVFVDEFPKLTKRSKLIIAELMLVGRKEGVWLIFAAQGATRELLGSNIAQHPALKILGACRDVDTTQALGGGAIDWGYLPHRLQPKSGDNLNDVAKTYIVGAPGVSEDPMLHKWHHIPDDEGGRRAAERLAAGLVDVDRASIDAALTAPNPPSLKLADDEDEYLHYVPWPNLLAMCAEDDDDFDPDGADEADLPPILTALWEAFEKHGAPDFLLTDQVLQHLATTGEEWRKWDDREPTDRRREGAKKIARDLKKAGITELGTVRRPDLDKDNPPSGFLLADIEAAIKAAAV